MIKETLKKILPGSVIRNLIRAKETVALGFTPSERLNMRNLRALTTPDLDAIMADTVLTASYKGDKGDVDAVFPASDVYGGINPGDRRAVYHLIGALKPANILEVGTHIGASTLIIAKALVTHCGPEARMTTIDILDVNAPNGPWKKNGLSKTPQQSLAALGLEKRVTFLNKPMLEVLRETPERYDLIFLDGDHRAGPVYREIVTALSRLNDNGVLLMHDVYPKGRALYSDSNVIFGPWAAIKRVLRENENLMCLPLGDLPWPTKQGVHTTTLALITRKG